MRIPVSSKELNETGVKLAPCGDKPAPADADTHKEKMDAFFSREKQVIATCVAAFIAKCDTSRSTDCNRISINITLVVVVVVMN
jgi:hypothetical protein